MLNTLPSLLRKLTRIVGLDSRRKDETREGVCQKCQQFFQYRLDEWSEVCEVCNYEEDFVQPREANSSKLHIEFTDVGFLIGDTHEPNFH